MAKVRRKSPPARKSSPPKPKAKASAVKGKPAVSHKPKVTPVAKGKPKPVPKPVPKPTAKPAAKGSKGAVRRPTPAPVESKAGGKAKTSPAAPVPVRRSTYVEAVALYERGVQLLQTHKFREAAEVLKRVISQFPDEKELHERARLYILVCERNVAAAAAPAQTTEDRVFAATLAINNGQLDQAISQLSAVIQQDPEHDHAAYMLGMAHALRGNVEQAVQCLGRAMALNVENRELVRKEPDLESLRRTDAMMALLASPPPLIPRKEKRPAAKPKRG